MMGLSCAFTLVSLGLSLRTYDVEMERLFYQPNPLFNTEALLIDALRKHSEVEISKRDELIAEYKRRVALRDEVLKSLLATAPAAEGGQATRKEGGQPVLPKPSTLPAAEGAPIGTGQPETETSVELRNLAQTSVLDSLYAQRLAHSFDSISKRLGDLDLVGAQAELDALRGSLASAGSSNSPMAGAALSLVIDLSASIAHLRTLSATQDKTAATAPSAEILAALRQAQSQFATARAELVQARSEILRSQAAIDTLDEANRLLRDRVASLEAPQPATEAAAASSGPELVATEPSAAPTPALAAPVAPALPAPVKPALPAPILPAPVAPTAPLALSPETTAPTPTTQFAATPAIRAAFLGTIALVTSRLILVDLAEGASPRLGATVAVYGRGASVELPPVALGIVSSVTDRIAQISLSPTKGGDGAAPPLPRLQDPVYLIR
ncbi:MAG TPA: hypothetical protein VMV44_09675 [Rectinemataceae bacterium]|nr:hypothetical protein [Rectinemataceae bacterium]